ncbi:hypothetical protein yc1106_08620 [Curvularia clavata]|uniref:Uncharacterized protein n=1 Tax=Curvularia clavata TaxID=95742 RepID=A0A9Q8ZFV4_CURCL|nr:hypothetical protein yc1106_08620 [Curvularia clavata]
MAKLLPLLHVLNILIGTLCATVLGLTARSIIVKHRVDDVVPKSVKTVGTSMLMWAGCGGIVDMEIKPTALFQNTTLFVATFILLRPLIVLSYTFTEHHDDTPERWGCEIGTGDNARSLCRDLRAARYLLIPILILAGGLLATAVWKRLGDNNNNNNNNNSTSGLLRNTYMPPPQARKRLSMCLTAQWNVAALTVAERQGLLDGPKADIFIVGKLAFPNAPISALMAWSYTMNAHFEANPLARTVTLKSSADLTAVQTVLKSTITTSGMGGENIAFVCKGTTLVQLGLVYQAGVALGMDQRVNYHAKLLKNLISENLISYEALNMIVKNIPSTDVMFQHLTQDLAYRRYKRTIPNAEEFEAWLQEHVALKDATGQADAPHKAIRKAARIAKAQEEKRQEAMYWARVAELKKKTDAAKGSIVLLTQEQAGLSRELGI